MTVRIRVLEEAEGAAAAWDAFVHATPEATFFHLSPWASVIRRAFGHKTYYAFAEQDGAVVGVLPLARMKTALFGDSLASTPYCVYGGPIAATPEAKAALDAHALVFRLDLSRLGLCGNAVLFLLGDSGGGGGGFCHRHGYEICRQLGARRINQLR